MHIPQPIGSRVLIIKQHNEGLAYYFAADPSQINCIFLYVGEIFILLRLAVLQLKICCVPLHFSSYASVQTTDLKEMLRVFRNRSPFLFPLSPPSSFIHPPLPFHHLPHLSLQCCRSESVCRRGMYVHTNTGCAVISPYANTERLLPCAPDSYK